jgi:hypothetical protein
VETDTTKAMQEALQSAVSRMNNGTNGTAEPKVGFMETIAPLLPLLPKLLQSTGASEEVLERMETQKGDLTSLREQVLILRKQCHRVLAAQEQLLEKVHEIQRQQVAAAGAVLDLAQQMARITFVDEHDVDDHEEYVDVDVDDLDAEDAPQIEYRTNGRIHKNGSGRRQRET